jgi:hypothetical protein
VAGGEVLPIFPTINYQLQIFAISGTDGTDDIAANSAKCADLVIGTIIDLWIDIAVCGKPRA